MKILKRIGLGFLLLMVLAVGGYSILVLNFDFESMPENYGKTATELYVGVQPNQPLFVGLGGGRGCNFWAVPRREQAREDILELGYAVLALEYFAGACSASGSGTPRGLDRISIEGIYSAIMEAAQDPRINEDCIIVHGTSAGSMVALSLASYYPEIKAVIGIAPASIVWQTGGIYPKLTGALAHNGDQVPFVPVQWRAGLDYIFSRDVYSLFNSMLDNEESVERGAIAVEKINGPILLVSGTQDDVWPATRMSDMIIERLRRNDFPYPFEHVPLDSGHGPGWSSTKPIIDAFLEENFLTEVHSGCPR